MMTLEALNSSFTKQLNNFLLQNIGSEDLNFNDLCRHMGMSKSKLYRNLKEETNMSINIYVRSFRLQIAKKMLLTTNHNVSEICYQVGFKDVSYFSRSFSKKFGMPPSDLKNLRNKK